MEPFDKFDPPLQYPIQPVGEILPKYLHIEKERLTTQQLKQLQKQWKQHDPNFEKLDDYCYIKLLNGLTVEQFAYRFLIKHHSKRRASSSSHNSSSSASGSSRTICCDDEDDEEEDS